MTDMTWTEQGFRAWLATQPDDRAFRATPHGCILVAWANAVCPELPHTLYLNRCEHTVILGCHEELAIDHNAAHPHCLNFNRFSRVEEALWKRLWEYSDRDSKRCPYTAGDVKAVLQEMDSSGKGEEP